MPYPVQHLSNIFLQLNLTELGAKVYADQQRQAVLLVSRDNGIRVTGMIGVTARITVKEGGEPRNDSRVAHKLFRIDGARSREGFSSEKLPVAEADIAKAGNANVNARCATPTTGPTAATIEAALVVSHEYSTLFPTMTGNKHKALIDYLRVLFTAPYTEILDQKYEKKPNLIEASSPDALFKFMTANEHLFGGVDLVYYLSRHNYAMTFEGGYHEVRGMAYAGSACGDFAGALVSDDATTMKGMTTIAHETLHALGSEHDGAPALDYIPNSPGATACPDNKQYIMTATPSHELLPLSPCTRDQVVVYLKTEQATCLKNAERRRSPPLSEANLRKPIINASRYCYNLHKDAVTVEHVRFHSDEYNIEKCILVCATTNSEGEKENNIYTAPDYMKCSETQNLVCIRGICGEIPSRPKPPHEGGVEVAKARLKLRSAVHKK
nr:venom metalloproteinase antarease TserMP_A-like isoform X2 [Dermacentor andersoni]